MAEGRQTSRRDLDEVQVHDGRHLPVQVRDRQGHARRQRPVPGPRRRLQGRLLRRLLSQRQRPLRLTRQPQNKD